MSYSDLQNEWSKRKLEGTVIHFKFYSVFFNFSVLENLHTKRQEFFSDLSTIQKKVVMENPALEICEGLYWWGRSNGLICLKMKE